MIPRSLVTAVAALVITVTTTGFGVDKAAAAPPASNLPASTSPGASTLPASTSLAAASSGAATPAAGAKVTGPAVASGPKVAPGVQAGANSLRLLGQSTDVEGGQAWQVHLAIGAAQPRSDRLRVQVYDRLTTRTGFDDSRAGRMSGSPVWGPHTLALSGLSSDTGGGVTFAIPVDESATDAAWPELEAGDESGIYPVQVQLLDGRSRPVASMITYLVFVAGTAAQTGFPKLDVALSLELGAAPALPSATAPAADAKVAAVTASEGRLPAATVTALGAEVAALRRHPAVPLSLAVRPQTADMLASMAGGARAAGEGAAGGERAVAAAAVAGLTKLVAGSDELLPSTYVRVSVPSLQAAGLSADVEQQFASGTSSLSADLHRAPETSTWVVDGPLDATTLAFIRAHGASRLILPAADFKALPRSDQNFTTAAPTRLSAPVASSKSEAAKAAARAGELVVDAADQQLGTYFGSAPDQVLAADQLLAELAMIQLETPSRLRGVSLLPPSGWSANGAFLDTLLGGLSENPLLRAVTADQLFSGIPAATGTAAVVGRTLLPAPSTAPFSDAPSVHAARAAAGGYSSVLPVATATAAELTRRILISESADLTVPQRERILGSVIAVADPLDHGISLPPSTSITLTARKGRLPLTILADASLGAHVELRLSSDKLTFEPFTPPDGSCSLSVASSESCLLVLTVAETTIKVPVEARTSGVFTLNVAITSPDGSLTFGTERDTVRSTAVSGVGVVLIILAALGLGYWWIRNIRHGRRARQLVAVVEPPPDVDGFDAEDVSKGGADGESPPDHSPPADTFADFFSSPPPDYPPARRRRSAPSVSATVPPGAVPPVSPSRRGVGPTT